MVTVQICKTVINKNHKNILDTLLINSSVCLEYNDDKYLNFDYIKMCMYN